MPSLICRAAQLWSATLVCLALGCTSTKQSNTARTATEQLLISNAVDQSLNKTDFTPLAGSRVFVEEKYLDCVDKGYIIASIHHKLLQANASLAPKPEDADVVMEVRSGSVGTDTSNSYLGMPGITVPGMLSLPDIKLISRESQQAVAKIGLVVYDVKAKQKVGEGGLSMARSDESNTYFMGFGPHQSGTLRSEVNRDVQPGAAPRGKEIPHQVVFRSPRRLTVEPEGEGRVHLSGGEDEE